MSKNSSRAIGQLGELGNTLFFHSVPLLFLLTLASLGAALAWNVGFEKTWTSDTTDTFYRIVLSTPGDAERGVGLLATLAGEVLRVFSEVPPTGWYQGIFDAYLRSFHLALGDVAMAYKVAIFPLMLIFSVGAYAFFWSLTGKRWAALALTVAALAPMPLAWAGERSGFGPVWNYTRRYLLTAWVPLLLWLFFRSVQDGRKLLLGAIAAAGLASNIHASGVILVQVFVLTWLVYGGITPKRGLQAVGLIAIGLVFSVTAASSLWAGGLRAITELMVAGLSSSDALANAVSLLPFTKEAVTPELQYLFYPPRIYRHLPLMMVDAWLLLTIFLSVMPIVLRARQKDEHRLALFAGSAMCLLFVSFEQMWPWVMLGAALFWAGRRFELAATYVLGCYLVIVTFWVTVVGMLIFQLAYQSIHGFPLVFNQLRGIRFMGFWVFVWLAALAVPVANSQLLTRNQLRLLLALLCLAFIVTGQTAYRQYFRVQDNDRLDRKKALLELAVWAKQNTLPNSVFLVGYSPFGVLAERAITHTDKTVRNEAINWLPPKGSVKPEEALILAGQFLASHVLLDTAQVSEQLSSCIRAGNEFYAIAETSCLKNVLKGQVVPGQPLP